MIACLVAGIGYALVYAALPSRARARAFNRARASRLLTIGLAVIVGSMVIGAYAFGPVVGPLVALAAALTAGSVLALIAPLVSPSSSS